MIHSKEHIENRLNELQQFSEGQYDNAEGSIIMDCIVTGKQIGRAHV